ncbi:hypothetical protein CupriaWKF_25810 [Cupriavidus sp. WKF15]|uniref:glycoside hydrolase family 19 protein n=1 Tax=Cupriavidus sp. WKF15 TaxID=3032282 RepID=UPI0023E29EF4|nr:hypothetical protein [Cupriavidus sp. WKF15]WER48217.1 hypothetical protein CupriaWKF_25810 [Cupriavidus sp. WKF15]
MANTTPTPALPPLKQLRFTFPFRKKGKGNASVEITDEHEFHKILKNEPSGTYSVSSEGMWHGGIHVSEAGSGSLLDLKCGVRCIADGEVVAWRLNRTYLTSELPAEGDKPAFSAAYSTGFALVRHQMEFPRGTKLTFFSLYMHLQDFAGYESDPAQPKPAYWSPEFKVTRFAKDKPHPNRSGTTAPTQLGLRARATHPHGTPFCILPQGTQFSISERAGDWGKIKDTHGTQLYPPTVGAFVATTAAAGGWAFLGKENGGGVVEAVMPDSLLDRVVVPTTPIPIKAGDLIGYLGRYDSLNKKTSNKMVHIEVFCGDDIKTVLEKSRAWIEQNAHLAPDCWKQFGLPSDPTILRIAKQTKLYKAALNEGQGAPLTGVVQVLSLAELGKQQNNKVMETTPGAADHQKRPWWKVDSANVRGENISGWVREEGFDGGRVTLEYPQEWVDFDTFEDPHDPTHTMFATAKAYVDYSLGKDVPSPGALDKLSPLMARVYRAIYTIGDGSHAADELCDAADDPWRALRMSRLIIKHESEWANPAKWIQLIQAIEAETESKAQHKAEQQRIEKLVWWDEVKAGIPNLPGSDVFHIHPIGLVGNFACERQPITMEMLIAAEPGNSRAHYEGILPYLNMYAKIYDVSTPKRIAHFLSQVAHESALRVRSEDLDFRPKIMRKTFGCKGGKKNYNESCDDCTHGRLREKLWSQESYYAHNPEHLGSYVYADRMGNGGESTGEGFKYRGRGILQVTGKAGYQSFQDEHNKRDPYDIKDFISHPELISENAQYAVESAFIFWSKNNLNPTADSRSVADVTQKVNGGQNGYPDRLRRYNKVAAILGLPQST